MPHEVLVSLTRGNLEESHHFGAYCVVRDDQVLRTRGDIDEPVFFRSAAKPFQAITVVESGAPDQFGFTDQELALVVGSHSSTPGHAQCAASMFKKMGESPDLLRCGGHRPIAREVHEEYVRQGRKPGRLEDNCSGKHAGMIAAAKVWEEDTASYADPSHRVQLENLANVALLTGVQEDRIGRGTDGCAVPSFAVPVRAMARAAAHYTTPDELPYGKASAARRVMEAALKHPEMVAGEKRFDTEVMRAAGGRLLAKEGAEGVQLIGVLGERMGIAIKIADGAPRALHAVAVALLIDLGLLDAAQAGHLAQREVVTREGAPIGEVKVRL